MCSRSLLNESSCFFLNNKIYCREDYCRTQCTQSYHKCRGNQCTRCGFPIKPGEMFQTAKFSKFHWNCFCCVVCNTPIKSGDQFMLTSDSFLTCMAHTNQFWPPSSQDGSHYDYKSIRASFDPRYKQKRIRTSFKNYQINAMKRAFQMKPNPDASDLKTLAVETGLTKRVLQVWFQNARAKQRKLTTDQRKVETSSPESTVS
ncbi:unnamed protein product [Oikopleura dioica]|uniref:Uncharacterized protein n=1 Tax=Oikopleura dioica TaxID=34765 RepID=E4XWD1_OIKDI|nr:unnamed protein product [Oikopleura dioica]